MALLPPSVFNGAHNRQPASTLLRPLFEPRPGVTGHDRRTGQSLDGARPIRGSPRLCSGYSRSEPTIANATERAAGGGLDPMAVGGALGLGGGRFVAAGAKRNRNGVTFTRMLGQSCGTGRQARSANRPGPGAVAGGDVWDSGQRAANRRRRGVGIGPTGRNVDSSPTAATGSPDSLARCGRRCMASTPSRALWRRGGRRISHAAAGGKSGGILGHHHLPAGGYGTGGFAAGGAPAIGRIDTAENGGFGGAAGAKCTEGKALRP